MSGRRQLARLARVLHAARASAGGAVLDAAGNSCVLATSGTAGHTWRPALRPALTRGFAAAGSEPPADGGGRPVAPGSNKHGAAETPRDKPPPPTTPQPHWLQRLLPPAAWPYAELARLDKPAGTAMLLWPCWWSIALAAPAGAAPDPRLLALFGVGAVLLRGAGCTINDWWDRDVDRLVARTAARPLARGAVTPTAAAAFAAAQLLAGLGVLLQLNPYSIGLGAASLPLVAGYPLAKRFTDWPQAILGLTFNWGALLGWAAVTGSLDAAPPLLLYASGIAWTLAYDTVYAFQDAAHDAKAGVRSSARALAARGAEKSGVAAFWVASLSLLTAAGAAADLSPAFYAGIAAAATHAAWQLTSWRVADAADGGRVFRSNARYGGLVFAAIVAGKVVGL